MFEKFKEDHEKKNDPDYKPEITRIVLTLEFS